MTFPKADDETKAFLRSVLPEDPRVQTKPMFGQLAGFVNGNMFAGLYGSAIVVRLPDADREALLHEAGASPFEPMPGRPMKEYVVLPAAWRDEPDRARQWLARSLAWVREMPEKTPKPRKKKA